MGDNEAAVCERDGCAEVGRRYYRSGGALSTQGFNSTTLGPQPNQPITLCSDHALATFGVAFTHLPGDPS